MAQVRALIDTRDESISIGNRCSFLDVFEAGKILMEYGRDMIIKEELERKEKEND